MMHPAAKQKIITIATLGLISDLAIVGLFFGLDLLSTSWGPVAMAGALATTGMIIGMAIVMVIRPQQKK